MILDNNYMVKKILSPQECSQIVETGVKHLQQAQTFKSSTGEKDEHRNSEVAWFTDPSFIKLIAPAIAELNNVAGWAYDVDEVQVAAPPAVESDDVDAASMLSEDEEG